MELKITLGRVIRVWWALLWRYIVLLALLVVFVAGISGICVAVLRDPGPIPPKVDPMASTLVVFFYMFLAIAGLYGVMSVIPVWLVLRKNYGEFRIALVPIKPETPESSS